MVEATAIVIPDRLPCTGTELADCANTCSCSPSVDWQSRIINLVDIFDLF